MVSYWDIPGFENLYLEDSWVTAISATPGHLKIDVDLVLRGRRCAGSLGGGPADTRSRVTTM